MAGQIQKIAVTGGPGSGKSTLCRILYQMGFPVLNLDLYAKRAVNRGTPAYHAIVSEFGTLSLAATGDLDRSWLRKEIVRNPHAKARLEAIIHPEVYRLLDEEVAFCLGKGLAPIIVEFPLLFEMKKEGAFDLVLVVFVSPETQVERVMARDGVTEEAAKGLINLQMPLSEKAGYADLVLCNDGTPEDLAATLQEQIRSGRFPALFGSV